MKTKKNRKHKKKFSIKNLLSYPSSKQTILSKLNELKKNTRKKFKKRIKKK